MVEGEMCGNEAIANSRSLRFFRGNTGQVT